MKIKRILSPMIALAMVLTMLPVGGLAATDRRSCETITDVQYIAADLFDYDWEKYNIATGALPGAAADKMYTYPEKHMGTNESNLGYGANAITEGLAKPTLNNGNIQFKYATAGFFDGGTNVHTANGTTEYRNYKFPFQVDHEGYYTFNSSENHVVMDAQNKLFKLHRGREGQTVGDRQGFFPFSPDGRSEANGQFGMTMTIPFMIPEGGRINGRDMVFEFSGDDDMWVYIDDQLVLDIGGAHLAMSGSINFRTMRTWRDRVYSAKNQIRNNVRETFTLNQDLALHTMKIFYMERNGGDSNCEIRFNMQLEDNTLAVRKEVFNDPIDSETPYEFTLKLGHDSQHLSKAVGKAYTLTTSNGQTTSKTTDKDGKFTLKHQEEALFQTDAIRDGYYEITETTPTNGLVSFFREGTDTQFSDGATAGKAFNIGSNRVTFKNSQKGNLTVTKTLERPEMVGDAAFQVAVTGKFVNTEGDSSTKKFVFYTGETVPTVQADQIAKLSEGVASATLNSVLIPGNTYTVTETAIAPTQITDYTSSYEPSFIAPLGFYEVAVKNTPVPSSFPLKVIYKTGVDDAESVTDMPDPASQNYYYNTEVQVANNPSREQYTFVGWKTTDVDGTEKIYRADQDAKKSFMMPAKDVTLVAQWSLKTAQLNITKKLISGLTPGSNDTFKFTLQVNQQNYSGNYSVGENNRSTNDGVITLKAGETASVDLPEGTAYTIVEEAQEKYVLSDIDGTTTATQASGTLTAQGETHVFTNKLHPYLVTVNYVEVDKDGQWVQSISQTKATQNYGDAYNVTAANPDAAAYAFVKTEGAQTGIVTGNVEVTHQYIRKEPEPQLFGYSVSYYYNDVLGLTVNSDQTFVAGSTIEEYAAKTRFNNNEYTFSRDENFPLVIGEDATQNVIRVYYVNEAIEAKPTVQLDVVNQYYRNGSIDEGSTQDATRTVLGGSTMGVNRDSVDLNIAIQNRFNNQTYTLNAQALFERTPIVYHLIFHSNDIAGIQVPESIGVAYLQSATLPEVMVTLPVIEGQEPKQVAVGWTVEPDAETPAVLAGGETYTIREPKDVNLYAVLPAEEVPLLKTAKSDIEVLEAQLAELEAVLEKTTDEEKIAKLEGQMLICKIEIAQMRLEELQKDENAHENKQILSAQLRLAELQMEQLQGLMSIATSDETIADLNEKIAALQVEIDSYTTALAANTGDKKDSTGEKQPAVEGEKQPAAEGEKQPAVEDEKQPAVEDEKQPAVEDEKQPAAEGEKQPAVEGEKQPAVEDEKQPAVEDEKQPAVEGEKQPAVEGEKQPTNDATEPTFMAAHTRTFQLDKMAEIGDVDWPKTIYPELDVQTLEAGYNYKLTLTYNRKTGSSHSEIEDDTHKDPTSTIPEPEVPLASAPNLVTLLDQEVPLGRLPASGGSTGRMVGRIGLLGLLVGSLVNRRRKKDEDDSDR
ncbi:MAG: fibro-slime domain-containing protein [Oscillospiraceae bacterium]